MKTKLEGTQESIERTRKKHLKKHTGNQKEENFLNKKVK